MPQARAYKDPLGNATWISVSLRSAFAQECGGQRMLRGEQLFRTDKVRALTTTSHDGVVFKAKVLSQDHRSNATSGAYSTRIKFNPVTDDEIKYAAGVLRNHPAWVELERQRKSGANVLHLPGKGINLAEPLVRALPNLNIIPQACSQVAEASCTCGDFAPGLWCKHVAAIGYQLVHFCEMDPFYPFFLRQLETTDASLPKPPLRKRKALPLREVIVLSDSEDVGSNSHGSSWERAIVC